MGCRSQYSHITLLEPTVHGAWRIYCSILCAAIDTNQNLCSGAGPPDECRGDHAGFRRENNRFQVCPGGDRLYSRRVFAQETESVMSMFFTVRSQGSMGKAS